jgi:CheY-like chemotaxis protein
LAISRKIAEIMGGSIGFDSTLGAGSTFWFWIPAERTGQAVPAGGPARSLAGIRVLAVDDNPVNLDVFRLQIESEGGEVHTCTDPRDGIAAARNAAAAGKPFDVAVLDHQMPGNTGLEMAEVIHGDPVLAGLPVILATSAPAANLQLQAAQAGIVKVLAKPVRQRVLIANLLMAIESPAPVSSSPRAAGVRPKPAAGDPLHILVADDVAINQQVAAGMLTKLGHTAEMAADGAEAVAKVRASDFDIVLMDVQMPRMNGLDATAAIRALGGEKSRVWVIAMTANAMDGDRETLLAAGMDDYISKPFGTAQLAATIGRWKTPGG